MIDEKKLIEEIKKRIEIYAEDYQAFRKYSGDRKTIDIAKLDECTEIIELIEKQPTADVAPIVHEEWLNFYGDFSTAECSGCAECYEVSPDDEPKKEYFDAFKKYYKFCPNCGAQMDGKITE